MKQQNFLLSLMCLVTVHLICFAGNASEIVDGQRSFYEFGEFRGVNLDNVHQELADNECSLTSCQDKKKKDNNIVLASLTFVFVDEEKKYTHKTISLPDSNPETESEGRKQLVFESSIEPNEKLRFKESHLPSIKKSFSLQMEIVPNLSDVFAHVKKTFFQKTFMKKKDNYPDYISSAAGDFLEKKDNLNNSLSQFSSYLLNMNTYFLKNIVIMNEYASVLQPVTEKTLQKETSSKLTSKENQQQCSLLLKEIYKKIAPESEYLKSILKYEDDLPKAISSICRTFWHSEPRVLTFLIDKFETLIAPILDEELLEGVKLCNIFLNMHSRLNNCDNCRYAMCIFCEILKNQINNLEYLKKHLSQDFDFHIFSSFSEDYEFKGRTMPYSPKDKCFKNLYNSEDVGKCIFLKKQKKQKKQETKIIELIDEPSMPSKQMTGKAKEENLKQVPTVRVNPLTGGLIFENLK